MASRKPRKLRYKFSDDDIAKTLEEASKIFGLVDGFRQEQVKALAALLRGQDALVSLPTGSVDSSTFQAASFCRDFIYKSKYPGVFLLKSVVIIVMPTQALISEEMKKAKELKIEAVDLTRTPLTRKVPNRVIDGLSGEKFAVLYARPEDLLWDDVLIDLFERTALEHRLCGLVIDDSHCVTKWGTASEETKEFRSRCGALGKLRKMKKLLIPIPFITLTATVTEQTKKAIADNLGLHDYVQISKPSEKRNVKHVVLKARKNDFDAMFGWLIEEVKTKEAACERVIIFCPSMKYVSEIYGTFRHHLPETHSKYFDMFLCVTSDDVKQKISNSFSQPDGDVRVLVATLAFGDGMDIEGVHTGVVCGRCTELDDYAEMTTRIGRDGNPSVVITIQFNGDGARKGMSETMGDLLKGDRCRREIIRQAFSEMEATGDILPHDCCDVCAASCTCDPSGCPNKLSTAEVKQRKAFEKKVTQYPLSVPSESQQDALEEKLMDYREKLLRENPGPYYCGSELTAGLLWIATIKKVLSESHIVFDSKTFNSRYFFGSKQIAEDVWAMVCSTLDRGSPPSSDEMVILTDTESDVESDDDDDYSSSDEYQRPVLCYSDDDEFGEG